MRRHSSTEVIVNRTSSRSTFKQSSQNLHSTLAGSDKAFNYMMQSQVSNSIESNNGETILVTTSHQASSILIN